MIIAEHSDVFGTWQVNNFCLNKILNVENKLKIIFFLGAFDINMGRYASCSSGSSQRDRDNDVKEKEQRIKDFNG